MAATERRGGSQEFGRWLRERRLALALTREVLARRVGCAPVSLRKLEAGERRPSRQMAQRLAECLELAPAERVAFLGWALAAPASEPPPLLGPLVTPAAAGRWSNLPVPPTALLGREAQVAALGALLRPPGPRLVTLTGPAGVGKTRLALEVAGEQAAAFAGGVGFVPLAPLRDPALVALTLAQTLGLDLTGGRSPLDALKQRLAAPPWLLLLDNFEQIVAAAPLVSELLSACPELRILVTSRAPLKLRWECQYPVPPLPLPDPAGPEALAQNPAVALFAEHARAVQPAFRLTARNAPAVAALCARLDGLPLAIELVAARSALLSPAALLAQLEPRLALLTDGPRDLPARQRSLRAALDWSYALLTPARQTLLARLGVFAGGAPLAAIAAVCAGAAEGVPAPPEPAEPPPAAILASIAALRDQSLVQVGVPFEAEADEDGETRVGLLETIREYAPERLAACGDADTTRGRHAAYYLALAEAAEPHYSGPEEPRWLARLEREHANLRAALAWLLARGEVEPAARLIGALARFWWLRGYLSEGPHWLEQALARPAALARAGRAKALSEVGLLASSGGDYGRAQRYLEEGLALFEALGDQVGIAKTLNRLGLLARHQGDGARAHAHLTASVALWRELGDKGGLAQAVQNLGAVAVYHADVTQAERCFLESLALNRELGNPAALAANLNLLGLVALRRLDGAQARSRFLESLAVSRELGQGRFLAESLEGLAGVAALRGQLERALRVYGAARALREALGAPLAPPDRAFHESRLAAMRAQLGEAAFAAALAAGRALPLDQAVAKALAADSA